MLIYYNIDISYNVVSKYFGELCTPLKHIFDLSFENGIFPDSLKIAKATLYINLVRVVA